MMNTNNGSNSSVNSNSSVGMSIPELAFQNEHELAADGDAESPATTATQESVDSAIQNAVKLALSKTASTSKFALKSTQGSSGNSSMHNMNNSMHNNIVNNNNSNNIGNPNHNTVMLTNQIHNMSKDEIAMQMMLQEEAHAKDQHDAEFVLIHDDVYNMFFLSNMGGQAFFYCIYVFSLKLALYTFLALDAVPNLHTARLKDGSEKVESTVLAAQCLMLPVAVAMQEDLIATYYLIANIKYCPTVRLISPAARKWKYSIANTMRGIDGMCSLFVNFVVLMTADEILPMFLNFAALQFLQTIDNIALQLAAAGYLTEQLEHVALTVKATKLPKKHSKFFRALDSVLFLSTFLLLLVAWIVISFAWK
jgi:hypothetical protein